MRNLTMKNIPDPLYERLRERAERHRRSVNSEVITLLEEGLAPRPGDPDELLVEVRALRERDEVRYLTNEALREG